MEMERREQQLVVARLAYQRWLKGKHEEDEVLRKERMRERELNKLKEAEKQGERRRAQEVFRSWKQQKDLELKLQRQMEREERMALTPPPRGMLCG